MGIFGRTFGGEKSSQGAPDLLWWSGTVPYDYEPDTAAVASAATLTELADLYGTDKGSLRESYYTRVYERILGSRETKALCEIGVACGASLKMWSRYLPHTQIVGIDVREECSRLCGDYPRIQIIIEDALQLDFTNRFDLLIDDASHIAEDIASFFAHCWNWVIPGGVYVVEDLGCTYLDGYTDDFNARYGTSKLNERSVILDMIDRLMRGADDDTAGSVSHFEYFPNMLLVHKRQSGQ